MLSSKSFWGRRAQEAGGREFFVNKLHICFIVLFRVDWS